MRGDDTVCRRHLVHARRGVFIVVVDDVLGGGGRGAVRGGCQVQAVAPSRGFRTPPVVSADACRRCRHDLDVHPRLCPPPPRRAGLIVHLGRWRHSFAACRNHPRKVRVRILSRHDRSARFPLLHHHCRRAQHSHFHEPHRTSRRLQALSIVFRRTGRLGAERCPRPRRNRAHLRRLSAFCPQRSVDACAQAPRGRGGDAVACRRIVGVGGSGHRRRRCRFPRLAPGGVQRTRGAVRGNGLRTHLQADRARRGGLNVSLALCRVADCVRRRLAEGAVHKSEGHRVARGPRRGWQPCIGGAIVRCPGRV